MELRERILIYSKECLIQQHIIRLSAVSSLISELNRFAVMAAPEPVAG